VHGRVGGRLHRPDHLDPHVRFLHRLREVAAQRRPRLVEVPADLGQQVLDPSAIWGLDGRLSRRQDATLRISHVRNHLLRQPLVALNVWCDRQPQQLGAVQQSDGDDPSGQAPGSDRRGRRLGSELPEPAQVSWMQLHRRVSVLPLPQHANDIAQLADGGLRSSIPTPAIPYHHTSSPHLVYQ